MALSDTNSWTGIREELLRRIHDRVWKPGERIPDEVNLASEFGCARTTVNRALRDLAEAGLVVRKRRAGTRIAMNPPHKATFTIQIIREEVEASGHTYRHSLLERDLRPLPPVLHGAFRANLADKVLYLTTLHFADGRPFAFEERHINLKTVPEAGKAAFDAVSANEWLVENAPFSHGDLSFFALNADTEMANRLGTNPGTALFTLERITWMGSNPITHARIVYAPGYRMRTTI